MTGILLTFFSSLLITMLIIRFNGLHSHFSSDSDFSGPQKFHKFAVPRIGGISIATGLFVAILIKFQNNQTSYIEVIALICTIPTFAIGLTEDLTKKISINLRLIFTASSALLAVYLIPLSINRVGVPFIDPLFSTPIIGGVFCIFAITGLANSYNIIDGFNGLASMVGMITLLAIAYTGYLVADLTIVYLSLTMGAAIFGFFILNYPRGLIFLGDGGAYLIGFWVAILSILLVNRHQDISPWFAIMVNGYPVLETLFTIYRRKIHQGKSPGQPDGMHFHTLIYRRVLIKNGENRGEWFSSNSRTSPYLWLLAIISISPAILWWDSSIALISSFLVFAGIYISLYFSIVKFKTPKWFYL